MEAAGLALGVVSAVGMLGQVFDGCVKAYSIFTTASNMGKDSDRMVCKVRIEEMRLLVWGREWGVKEGRLEAHLAAHDTGNDGLKKLAETILKQLLDTIGNTKKLRERYGIKEDGQAAAVDPPKKLSDPTSTTSPTWGEWRLKARWVIADRDKFDMLLRDLKDYNDGLERLFPPAKIPSLQRTWTNELLATAKRDVSQLYLLESAASGTYPQLNNSANLKQLRVNLDVEDSSKFTPTSALKIPRAKLEYQDEGAKPGAETERTQGTYQESKTSPVVPVIIEWAGYDEDCDLETRLLVLQRVDSLARMVHSASNRHPDLHTLDCLGYLDDSANKRYGLTYRVPGPTMSQLSLEEGPLSMKNLTTLIQESSSPDLDVRFELAHTLAVALWSFHSLDWLHKSISSENILFFSTDHPKAGSDLSRPYLTGFTTSRPSAIAEMTAPAASKSTRPASDLYRHPSSLGIWRQSYRHHFDVYSLGLVLLEIGLWKSLSIDYWKPKYTSATFRDKAVMPYLVPNLGGKTGSRYRKVVESCLRYGDEEDQTAKGADKDLNGASPAEQQDRMLEWVVGTLESLRV